MEGYKVFFSRGKYIAGTIVSLTILIFLMFFLPSPLQTLDSPKATATQSSQVLPQLSFSDETFIRGINHSHTERSKTINSLHELFGVGACPLDFNNDGWIDLFFTGGSGTHKYYGKRSWWAEKNGNRLYENKGNGYFEDVSEASKINDSYVGMACATGDLDNDNDHDIIISTLGGVYLYENLGDNSFRKITLKKSSKWSTTISLGDVNNDGLLDFYIANYINYSHYKNKYEPTSGHNLISTTNFNSSMFQSESNFLFINQGDLKFSELAKEYGVLNTDGRSVFAIFHDIDEDGFIDLFIGNKEGSHSKLFLNQSGNHFIESSEVEKFPFPKNYHSLSIENISGSLAPEFIFSGAAGQPISIYSFKQGRYQDISSEVIQPSYSGFSREQFGTIVSDLNQDNKFDLASVSGYMLPDPDNASTPLGQPNIWLLNDGHRLKSPQSLDGKDPYPFISNSSRSIISVDIDNDGDQDVVISNNNSSPKLLINNAVPIKKEYINQPQKLKQTTFLSSYEIQKKAPPVNHPLKQSKPIGFIEFKLIALITPQKILLEQLRNSYSLWSDKEKVLALKLLNRLNNPVLEHAIIQIALHDKPSIALIAIQNIKDKNYEALLHEILAFIASNNDYYSCKALNIVRSIFLREESFIRHRYILANDLTRNLDLYGPSKSICAIKALAKSRSKRPLEKLHQLAIKGDNEIAIEAIRALGMLKQNQSLTVLTSLSKSNNLKISNEANHALALLTASFKEYEFAYSEKDDTAKQSKAGNCELGPIFKPGDNQEQLLSLSLRLCSQRNIKSWAKEHSNLLSKNYMLWIKNWRITPETYHLFLNHFTKDNPHTAYLLAIQSLALNPPNNISEVIVSTITNSSTLLPMTLLTKIADNSQLSLHTRLYAIELILRQDVTQGTAIIKRILEELP